MAELYWTESKNTLLKTPSLAKLELKIAVMITRKQPKRTDGNSVSVTP